MTSTSGYEKKPKSNVAQMYWVPPRPDPKLSFLSASQQETHATLMNIVSSFTQSPLIENLVIEAIDYLNQLVATETEH